MRLMRLIRGWPEALPGRSESTRIIMSTFSTTCFDRSVLLRFHNLCGPIDHRRLDEVRPDCMLESLRRMQAELQGETPSAYTLWNDVRDQETRILTPKDEGNLSDFIKNHLNDVIIPENKKLFLICKGKKLELNLKFVFFCAI